MNLFDDFAEDEESDDPEIFAYEENPEGGQFAHPRAMTSSFGPEAVERKLLKFIESDRMPQALIFAGPQGIGKATMAYRFARFLLKQGIEPAEEGSLFGASEEKPAATSLDISPEDPIFKRVASGGHADLLTIERDYDETKNRFKESVSVEAARKIAPFLRMTAADGGWRVVIVDDADTMNRNAQNAMLKILEEPPKKTVIILVAHRTGALIPTIHSRSQIVNFAPLNANALMEALRNNGHQLSTDQAEFLSDFARGSLGRAVAGIEQEVFAVFESISQIFRSWPAWNGLDIYALADELSRGEKFEMFQKLMLWIMGTLAQTKARGRAPGYDLAGKPAFSRFFEKSSLEEILKICENLEGHFNKVNAANLDKRQAVTGAFTLMNI